MDASVKKKPRDITESSYLKVSMYMQFSVIIALKMRHEVDSSVLLKLSYTNSPLQNKYLKFIITVADNGLYCFILSI